MISSPGLGSNLDISGIIAKLMAVESIPLTYLAQQEGKYQAKLSSLGQIKSALASFETAAEGLTSAADDTYSAVSGDTDVLTASASSTATAGTHSISISQLAAAQRLVAAGQVDATAAIGSGAATTITISFGTISGGTFDSGTGIYKNASFAENTSKTPLTLTIDSSNNTLEGIRDAINALDSDVTASIVNDGSATPYRLTLTTNDTGVNNSLKIDVVGEAAIESLLAYDASNNNGQNLSQTGTAANAAFTVDGIGVTSASNTASDVIAGVTLNLKGTGATTLTVSRDASAVRTALETLISAFNDLDKNIKEATGLEAVLQGDRAAVYVQTRLRAALGERAGDVGQFSTLSEIGVRFQRDGSLKLDSSKLQSALDTSITDVRALVTAFGESLTTLANQLTGEDGPLNSRTDGLNRTIADIADRRESLNRRLDATEARLRAQFTALDSLVSGLLSTSAYLEQQLANLPKITNQNNK